MGVSSPEHPTVPVAALQALITNPALARELSPGLYTALPPEADAAPYDRKAALYDAVVGRSVYHRVVWGTSARAYTRFGRAALDAAGPDPFAEIGCGSLLFTAAMYRETPSVSPVLIDRSLRMLRRAITRLDGGGARNNGWLALHADAAALPLRPGAFSSILSLNLLHVPCDRDRIVSQIGRLLIPGRGRLFASSLIRSGRWGDAALALLHRTGEFGVPLTAEQVCDTIAGGWGRVESLRVEGNMAFVVVRHAG
jgi:SAM-dependent methyltransferase